MAWKFEKLPYANAIEFNFREATRPRIPTGFFNFKTCSHLETGRQIHGFLVEKSKLAVEFKFRRRLGPNLKKSSNRYPSRSSFFFHKSNWLNAIFLEFFANIQSRKIPVNREIIGNRLDRFVARSCWSLTLAGTIESRNSLFRLSSLLGIGFVFNASILTTSVRIRSVNNAALYHRWSTTVELIKTFDLVSLFGLSLLESYFSIVEKFPKVKRANESSSLEYASLRTLILRANISYARWKVRSKRESCSLANVKN